MDSKKLRIVKLQFHSRPKGEEVQDFEDLHLNSRDFPELKVGDVVEIYHPEDEYTRLLLQIKSKSFKDDYTHNIISVDDSVAKTFCLRCYRDVVINRVNPEDVELNLLELTLKDQYFSRSDMWRYRSALMGSCAYLHKRLVYDCGRTCVHEMWAKGTRVACGVIGPNTKIVYRSMTANVYIFIQMSAEMWEFDFYGDLYFEKSVKGFLADLFDRWKDEGANHDVTIVLFSRTFYEAKNKHEFPCSMRKGLLQDYKGRFYEDFYRIVVQNEKYDDWTLVLMKLKTLFHEYNESVVNFHSHPGVKLPRSYNSTASEGNVLEVLNMGLNVFEKHDVDRNFERTGQMSVVITPSTGVFEVDRELLMLTKQKSIDYGIGNDLVFMGEQPLHVVPLFILHNKRKMGFAGSGLDDYAIPNWLNYSYYTSKEAKPNVFVPRIHIPEQALIQLQKSEKTKSECAKKIILPMDGGSDSFSKTFINQPRPISTVKHRSRVGTRRLSESAAIPVITEQSTNNLQTILDNSLEDNYLLSASLETANPLRPNAVDKLFDNLHLDTSAAYRKKNKKGLSPYLTRSLINPLAPSKIPGKLTSNRAAVQTHHFRVTSNSEETQELSRSPVSDKETSIPTRDTESPRPVKPRRPTDEQRISSYVGSSLDGRDDRSVVEEDLGMADSLKSPSRSKNRILMGRGSPAPSGSQIWGQEPKKRSTMKIFSVWGITGEMEWSANLTTGVDWKALTIPASLPITTDYLPDFRTLQRDYLISDYSVLPEDPAGDGPIKLRHDGLEQSRYYSRPLALNELYEELILQRLQQGFQLIIPSDVTDALNDTALKDKLAKKNPSRQKECCLSLGRVIHKLVLETSSITVTRLHPRHTYKTPEVQYLYRFMVPDMTRYEVSTVKFAHMPLESLNWNYVDFCVVNKGHGTEFKLEYTKKHWKCQYYLLPCNNPAVLDICRGAERCDIYGERTTEEYDKLCEGFIRIMEMCNRMKRPAINRSRISNNLRRGPNKTLTPLHRDSVAFSTPDLQSSAASTPRQDHTLPHHFSNSEISKIAANFGIDINASEIMGSSPRSIYGMFNSPSDILDAMKLPAENVVSTVKVNDLQPQFFVSYEAVIWAMETLSIPTVEMAVDLFSKMIQDKLIIHASGDPSHPFICGFYLYNIIDPDIRQSVVAEFVNDDVGIEQVWSGVWLECAVLNHSKGALRKERASYTVHECLKSNPKFTIAEFAGDAHNLYQLNQKKSCVIDVDMNHKSSRLEWAIVNYNATYTPKCAFGIEMKWIQASGPMFGDLIAFWSRKCTYNGFHIIPTPSDPFALPQKPYSDPLRMPIFIPLAVKHLTGDKRTLFEDFPADSRYLRMVLFQEEILRRFGFMYLQENVTRTNVELQFREYVHVCGGMFVMIPARLQKEEVEAPDSSFPGFEADCGASNTATEAGFWWAWNSCLTKKWRTTSTGDEAFLDRMLEDFRSFCSDANHRLQDLWEEIRKGPL